MDHQEDKESQDVMPDVKPEQGYGREGAYNYNDPYENPIPPNHELELAMMQMEMSMRITALDFANRVSGGSSAPNADDVVARAEKYFMFLSDSNGLDNG